MERLNMLKVRRFELVLALREVDRQIRLLEKKGLLNT